MRRCRSAGTLSTCNACKSGWAGVGKRELATKREIIRTLVLQVDIDTKAKINA
jgi:hypothetical protein